MKLCQNEADRGNGLKWKCLSHPSKTLNYAIGFFTILLQSYTLAGVQILGLLGI